MPTILDEIVDILSRTRTSRFVNKDDVLKIEPYTGTGIYANISRVILKDGTTFLVEGSTNTISRKLGLHKKILHD